MKPPSPDGSPDGLVEAYATLRRMLKAIEGPDRRIALDAVRDALDRDADGLRRDIPFIAGTFAVDGLIASGQHFEVLRLRHRDAGTMHALKRPVAERRNDPLLRRLLLAEARHQAAVVHPACLPCRALLRLEDGRPGLLTDFVDAPTLADRMRTGPLADGDIRALGIRVCEALQAIHGTGLVHGDLTPANLFVPGDDFGAALLFDFGLSRPLGSQLTEDLHRVGTPAFAAPESYDPLRPAAAAADLYGLGRALLAASGDTPSGTLGGIIPALTAADPAERPNLDETLETLKACGAPATDEGKCAAQPGADKPRPL